MDEAITSEKKPRILLAEDEDFIAKTYIKKLTLSGFDVDHVTDGELLIEKIKSTIPYDILLLDLLMPKKNGFEVLEEIKKDNLAGTTAIIILSNLGQSTDVEKAQHLGACDFVVKANTNLKELVAVLRKHLPTS